MILQEILSYQRINISSSVLNEWFNMVIWYVFELPFERLKTVEQH